MDSLIDARTHLIINISLPNIAYTEHEPELVKTIVPPQRITIFESPSGSRSCSPMEIASSETHSPPTRSPTKIVSSAAGEIAGEQMSARW